MVTTTRVVRGPVIIVIIHVDRYHFVSPLVLVMPLCGSAATDCTSFLSSGRAFCVLVACPDNFNLIEG